MIDRDHHCPLCGSYLPILTVKIPVYKDRRDNEFALPILELIGYEEREEASECARCTGSY